MNTMSALLACVWMIPGALIGYIVTRIFKWDAKLGAAIGALALFAVYLGSTSTIISEVGEYVVGIFYDPESADPNPMSEYKDRGFGD